MANQLTPFLRPLRDNSGTIYVFPSAVEDIGLNLDVRGNKVALTKYVVLNLPPTDSSFICNQENSNYDSSANYFNFTNIPGIANILNDSYKYTENDKIAIALQDYLMNMETTIINQEDYDYAIAKTVSERCFWKFLKETGAIRWVPIDTDTAVLNGQRIYKEEESQGYNRVVQSIGQISAGNSITNDFGLYNETYVNIPTTYGASQVYFKITEDNNYRLGEVYTSDYGEYLAGRNSALSTGGFLPATPAYDSQTNSESNDTISDIISVVEDTELPWYRFSDDGNNIDYSYFTEGEYDPTKDEGDINYVVSVYGTDNEYNNIEDSNLIARFYRSRLDGVEVVTDIDEIDMVYDQIFPGHDYITYDTINIDSSLIYQPDYEFNSILLYYTIYDYENGNELATNLFGIVFLSAPKVNTMVMNTGNSLSFSLPTFEKRKSNGPGSENYFGTGYSFKINIRSLSVYDNSDALIIDNTTSSPLYTEDFNSVIFQLNNSVDLMIKNSEILADVWKDYKNVAAEIDDLQFQVQKLSKQLNEMNLKKFNDIDSSNIYTYDLTVYHKTEISGSLFIDAETDFDIPYFDVSTLKATGIYADDASFSSLSTDTLEMISLTTSTVDTSTLLVNGGGVYTDDCPFYLSNDSLIYKEVIEPTSYTLNSDGTSYLDSVEKIIDNIQVAPINHMFEIIPSSFSVFDDDDYTQYLYTVAQGNGYINYDGFVPVLIAYVQKLKKEIDELKNK